MRQTGDTRQPRNSAVPQSQYTLRRAQAGLALVKCPKEPQERVLIERRRLHTISLLRFETLFLPDYLASICERALAESAAFISNVAANVVLIPRFSFVGAAWVTVACELVLLVSFRIVVARVTPSVSLIAGARSSILATLPMALQHPGRRC